MIIKLWMLQMHASRWVNVGGTASSLVTDDAKSTMLKCSVRQGCPRYSWQQMLCSGMFVVISEGLTEKHMDCLQLFIQRSIHIPQKIKLTTHIHWHNLYSTLSKLTCLKHNSGNKVTFLDACKRSMLQDRSVQPLNEYNKIERPFHTSFAERI